MHTTLGLSHTTQAIPHHRGYPIPYRLSHTTWAIPCYPGVHPTPCPLTPSTVILRLSPPMALPHVTRKWRGGMSGSGGGAHAISTLTLPSLCTTSPTTRRSAGARGATGSAEGGGGAAVTSDSQGNPWVTLDPTHLVPMLRPPSHPPSPGQPRADWKCLLGVVKPRDPRALTAATRNWNQRPGRGAGRSTRGRAVCMVTGVRGGQSIPGPTQFPWGTWWEPVGGVIDH